MIKIHTLLLCLLAFLSACNREEPTRPKLWEENSPETKLNPEEVFFYSWAEVIARTEAINKRAKEITRERNLYKGDPLPPSDLGIKNAPEENPVGAEEYDLFLEATAGRKTIPFWIHVDNTVPDNQGTIAFASTLNPNTGETILYPRTKYTEAKKTVVLLTYENDQTEKFLDEWKKQEEIKKRNQAGKK